MGNTYTESIWFFPNSLFFCKMCQQNGFQNNSFQALENSFDVKGAAIKINLHRHKT